MIGFKVIINKETFVAGIQDGVASVIIDRLLLDTRNYLTISLGGYNSDTDSSIHWLKKELFLGDKITVKVIEVMNNSSTPIEKTSNREEFSKHPSNIGLELSLKGKVISACVAKGNIHLIATLLNKDSKNEILLDFIATDMTNEDSPKKYEFKNTLQLGDAFTIEVKDVTKMTIPNANQGIKK